MVINSTSNSIGTLNSISFDVLLKQQNPFGSQECTFDLRGIHLITPAALVQLAAVCHALEKTGQQPVVVVDDPAVRSYLIRSSFTNAVKDVAHIEPSIPTAAPMLYESLRGSSRMLVEVTKIESGAALPDLLDRIVWTLRYRLKYRKHDAFDVTTVVSELCQNTFDHNVDTCGFLAMQVYGRGASRFLEIGVADYGDGLATTLKRNAKNASVSSDLDAIRHATQLGTSEHDDPTRGTGLYHLLKITYKHGGSVQIRSGAGKVRFRMDKRAGWSFPVIPMPGVHVAFNLPSKANT